MASTYPTDERKKSCTPFAACASVRLRGSVGLVEEVPGAVAVKLLASRSTVTVEATALFEVGRSGVLKYA